ncbi:MAG TPA: hypothetical protein VM936_01010 [Pyrinomonadaceae bacterium]|jgi:hypothetical protein|nr:hypothetical protein [Pyrinomonadaceae bacterium]
MSDEPENSDGDRATPCRRRKNARLGLPLFLLLWLAYGVALNSGNLYAFGLQQIGIEAYVERHTFYIEGSPDPRFQVKPEGDCFLYGGHIYPAKQPGQFMAGALVYFPLRALGLSYREDYLLVAALVTFFTASLVTALAGVAVFLAARGLAPEGSGDIFWPTLSALSYAFGTTAFAYSGVPWHDEMAAGYLTIGLYLLFRLARGAPRRPTLTAACAGLTLGLTVTTSMLPFFMAAAAAVYFLSLRRWSLLPAFLLGGLAGLAPLLVYNAVCFGNPLLVPNVAGGYGDTFFRPDSENFLSKLVFYARMLTLYAPVFWAGLAGLALLPRGLRRERLIIVASLAALAAYVLNIEADGTCQYGPRYMLPAMPLACLGLAGFAHLRGGAVARAAAWAVAACAMLSAFINLVGALHGAMLCYFPHFAVGRYLSEMWDGGLHSHPLAPWLAPPLLLCAALFARALIKQCRER